VVPDARAGTGSGSSLALKVVPKFCFDDGAYFVGGAVGREEDVVLSHFEAPSASCLQQVVVADDKDGWRSLV
jgi:hypothetical protein